MSLACESSERAPRRRPFLPHFCSSELSSELHKSEVKESRFDPCRQRRNFVDGQLPTQEKARWARSTQTMELNCLKPHFLISIEKSNRKTKTSSHLFSLRRFNIRYKTDGLTETKNKDVHASSSRENVFRFFSL